MFGEVKCKKCGKVLDSVTLTYGGDWLCGECADNVESIEIGGYLSSVHLKEIPNQKFNTVHFVRC